MSCLIIICGIIWLGDGGGLQGHYVGNNPHVVAETVNCSQMCGLVIAR